MMKNFNRRSFIGYISATLATSLLLKACADCPSTMILTESPGNDSTDSSGNRNSSETFQITISFWTVQSFCIHQTVGFM